MRRTIGWIAGLALLAATVAPTTGVPDSKPASDELIGANVFYAR